MSLMEPHGIIIIIHFPYYFTVLLLIMLLLSAVYSMYKGPGNTFLLDEGMLILALKETIAQSLFILAVGAIVAHYLRKKRYFGYRTQGGLTTKAYAEMLLAVSGAAALIPFKFVLDGLGL